MWTTRGALRSGWLRCRLSPFTTSAAKKDGSWAIFMAGLPGSGKTTVLNTLYGLENVKILDLDSEMKLHPRYDPAHPASIYADSEAYRWANEKVEERFQSILKLRRPGCGPDRGPLHRLVAIDGTGTKVPRRLRRIEEAKRAGYSIELLHSHVDITTALERNSWRTRQVPEEVMREYQSKLEAAIAAVSPFVDQYTRIDNSKSDGLTGMQRWEQHYEAVWEQSQRYDALWAQHGQPFTRAIIGPVDFGAGGGGS